MTSVVQGNGLLTCAAYAFAPNRLHFCGPEKQRDLQEYLLMQKTDQGLFDILNHFETVAPYLQLIAKENKIKDMFDSNVVDAYWVGNKLLESPSIRTYARFLEMDLQLKKKLPRTGMSNVLSKLNGGLPYHTFHVLNIFRRTGHHAIPHTLSTMDQCRISWGKVVEIEKKKSSEFGYIYIESPALEYKEDQLVLSKPQKRKVVTFLNSLNVNNWVSVHWDIVCQKITLMQKKRLEFFTHKALQLANQRT